MSSDAGIKRLDSVERKTCWVCFGTDEDVVLNWVRPCRCKGTAKWVHIRCLQRWIDEKQKSNPIAEVHCPQCNEKYKIVYPEMGASMRLLDFIEKYINKASPVLAGCVLLGSLYWTAVTYGAVTVMQVLGHKEGLNVMEHADPIFLLIGLPAIPIGLIIAKLLRWEEALLKLYRKHSKKIPGFSSSSTEETWAVNSDVAEDRLPSSYTRVLVGALIFPTISTLVGKLFFGSVSSNFQRCLLGGITYFGVKGLARMYYMQQSYMRRVRRTISQFWESEDTSAATSGGANSPQ